MLVQQLKPETARRIFLWQLLFFAVLLTASAVDNAYTVVADNARAGTQLPLEKPMVWEFSSHILVWLLIPLMTWWLAKFPVVSERWWRNLPAHAFATLPFSLLHVEGMVLLRKLAYMAAGARYDFGPFWDNWVYEFRKDFMTYWWVLAGLVAFNIYGLWLDARHRKEGEVAELEPRQEGAPLGRLVVRKLNREFILDMGEIDRIEADGNYVLVYASGQSYRLRDSLEGLARRLDEQRFARVHRAHVVNIDRIREIQPWDHGDYRIVLKDGSFVNFSRRYRSRLNHLFQ